MTVAVFVDTNVLVYAKDTTELQKQPKAEEWLSQLWDSSAGRISVQVLNEYYDVTTRKLQPGLKPEEARADVRSLRAWRPLALDTSLLESAWRIQDRFQLSFWDSLIVAAAHASGCEYLLTEDLQHDAEFDGMRVIDPFVTDPQSIAG